MNSNRVFQITFLISLAAHAGALLQSSGLSLFSRIKNEQNLEVSYLKEMPKTDLKNEPKEALRKREPLFDIPIKIAQSKKIPPPFGEKGIGESLKAELMKPALSKPDILAIKKKISLPAMKMDVDKINNPSYISYHSNVREKIKRVAYHSYTGQEEGQVTISFLVAKNGYLRDLRIVEGPSSSKSSYLRDIALNIIKVASPFPEFPASLDYPQLSFNLTIIFEVE
ncbi:MAG: TonB family protein [Candidatus Omnitrophota bacterium]